MPALHIVYIKFTNESTGTVFDLYPSGQHGIWSCVNQGAEIGHFEVKARNDGTAGGCRLGCLTYPDNAEYYHWEGNLANGQEIVWTTGQFYSGSWNGPGWSYFEIRCQDTTTTPYPKTDSKIVDIECATGFRIFVVVDGTQVSASGRIVETSQTFVTPLSGHAWIHVGADNQGKTYTIECTYQGITKQIMHIAELSMPVVQFQFGTIAPPNIKIESIRLLDKNTQGQITEYNVYPEGQRAYTSFGGERAYRVVIKNYGGDAEQACFSCEDHVTMIVDSLPAGGSWERTSAPIYNGDQNSFEAFIAARFCYAPMCSNPTETDRKSFTIYLVPHDTFPYPDDLWCETGLVTPDGQAWSQWEGQLFLDTISTAKVGVASIGYDLPQGYSHLQFDMINGQILCDTYVWFCFMIRCSDHTKLQGLYQVELRDSVGRKASIIDHVLMSNEFVARAFPVGTGNMIFWNAPTDFDWNAVKCVTFHFQTTDPIIVWIDDMHFRVGSIVSHNVYVTVKDRAGQPIPNITCMLGGYFDSIKWTYGSAVGKTDSAGNATIANIAVTDWQGTPIPSSYYVFCTDPSGNYTQLPSEEKVVNISGGDQSVEIIMDATPPDGGDGKWAFALGIGVVTVGAIGTYFLMKHK